MEYQSTVTPNPSSSFTAQHRNMRKEIHASSEILTRDPSAWAHALHRFVLFHLYGEPFEFHAMSPRG
jgi:hypothetical protein